MDKNIVIRVVDGWEKWEMKSNDPWGEWRLIGLQRGGSVYLGS